tara:strand:- start:413 stop:814 length:402 start_codon:yes stop_codon:yes gene_type:complete
MFKYLLLLVLIVSSCSEPNSSVSDEITIDINSSSFADNFVNNTMEDKEVFVRKTEMNNGDSIYFISMCYIGNDSLTKFHAGFKAENSFNKAKYSWTSDTSLNMTLFSTVNDSTEIVYLRGRKDGRGGQNGYIN